MKGKEIQEELAATMKTWQKIEDASVASTGKIMEETENPIIRLVMEIIQNDSKMHYRVQEYIRSTIEDSAVSLSPEELGAVWAGIEKHNEIEKKMVSYVEQTLEKIKGRKMLIQEYLLNYLQEDEKKHGALLDTLEKIKGGMYPYA
jgi:hypothetical protein